MMTLLAVLPEIPELALFLALGLGLVSGRRECLWGVLGVFECMVEPPDTWNICGGPKLQHKG